MPNYPYLVLRRLQPHASQARQIEHDLERDQWRPPAELQVIAWRKLKALLDHAYAHVPFYRCRFDALGLTPQDIQTPEDYRRLPLLTKEEIRQNEDQLIADSFFKSKMQRAVTSGSTGEPFVVYHDLTCEAANAAAMVRSRRWFGWEFGDKIAWIWGRRDEVSTSLKQRLIYQLKRERWLDGYRPTDERLQQYAAELVRWQPDMIAGYGNVIYLFAQYLDSHGITGIRPKVVETTGMTIWPHERELIKKAFQCPISDRYGSHETVSIVAAECPHGNQHIFSDLCYLEILVDGRPANYGEAGEVVATPLHALGMPLLRFRMNDVAVLDDKLCPCGRGLPLLRDIVGRVTSIFTLPSGKHIYGGIFRHLALKDATTIKKFRVHQYAKDKIEVTLQPGAGFQSDTIELIRHRCFEILKDEPVELIVTVTDDIPTTASGKFLVTTSDVPVGFN